MSYNKDADRKSQPLNGAGFYKRYPRDFLEGTALLPFELKCAYALLLDLIYIQNGELPDDPRYISGVLGCSVRKWNSIRKQLLDHGKIYIKGPFIANFRADKLLITAQKTRDKNAENASKRWKNNDLADAVASNSHSHRARDPDPYNNKTPDGVSLSRPPSAERIKTPRDVLWQDYLRPLRDMLAVPEPKARSAMGKLLKLAGNDANLVIDAIDWAIREPPFDPMPWLIETIQSKIKPKPTHHRKALSDGLEKLKQQLAD